MTERLVALERMTVRELQTEWQRVFNEAARSRNRAYLHKRIAYRIQEQAFGGLTDRAKARAEELAADAPLRRRLSPGAASLERAAMRSAAPPTRARDPRLPPAGTELRKVHHGVEHTVRVLDDGFEYRGNRYRSLSAIAKAITGTDWNGYSFFAVGKENAA